MQSCTEIHCNAALSILRLYALTPSDLFFKWEAFILSAQNAASKTSNSSSSNSAMKKSEALVFDLDNLRELKKEIQMSSNGSASIKREQQGVITSSNAAHSNGSAVAANRVKKLGGRAALDGMQVASL